MKIYETKRLIRSSKTFTRDSKGYWPEFDVKPGDYIQILIEPNNEDYENYDGLNDGNPYWFTVKRPLSDGIETTGGIEFGWDVIQQYQSN